TWATIPLIKFLPNNILLAGRLFSVISGFGALVGVFVLLWYLFGKKAAYWGSFFYLLTPYFLFYDRMALVDSAVNAAFIWMFFFSILLARTLRLDVALIYGLVSGMSLLAKSSTQMYLGMSALSPILFLQKNQKAFIKKLLNFSFLYVIVLVLAFAIYNVQRLSPFLSFVAQKNKTFVMTFGEFLQTPFLAFFGNIRIIPKYVIWESAFVLPLLGVSGLAFLFKRDKKLFSYFLLWVILPFLAIAFFAKVIFPRYLIFFASIFVFGASYLFSQLKNKKILFLFTFFFLLSAVYFDYTILFKHDRIPFPPVDRSQYIEGVASGWGIREIAEYAREQVKEKQKSVIIIAEGNFGMAGDVLDSSLRADDKISIRGYWPLNKNDLDANKKDRDKNYILVVFSHRTDFPTNLPIKFIKKIDKPGGQSSFYLFELWHEPYPLPLFLYNEQ
ncbi:glycosyltransferase family 39 protein, partial [Candidatus Roizmanbacteria bacterium]|nr:glycosyltransferase family 39 protein [Candidatus Roizmanbacteria bacterium]